MLKNYFGMEYGVAQMFPISVPIFNVVEDTDELKTTCCKS